MTSSGSGSWLDSKDFIQTHFRVGVKNVTTSTSVKKEDAPEIVELLDAGVRLKLPKRSTALGHLLHIQISKMKTPPHGKGENASLPERVEFTGKVVQEEPFDKNHKHVEIQFYQFNEIQWRNFLVDCLNRQRAVDSIIKKIQG